MEDKKKINSCWTYVSLALSQTIAFNHVREFLLTAVLKLLGVALKLLGVAL